MSDDNRQKTVSEETIASIVDAATHIAEDSNAMRLNMVAAAEALQPIIEQAGICFGAGDSQGTGYSESWQDSEGRYFRIAVTQRPEWRIAIEYTNSDIYQSWWGECSDIVSFEQARRDLIEEVVERLPIFILEYCEMLKRRHQRYADLQEKAKQIRTILQDKRLYSPETNL